MDFLGCFLKLHTDATLPRYDDSETWMMMTTATKAERCEMSNLDVLPWYIFYVYLRNDQNCDVFRVPKSDKTSLDESITSLHERPGCCIRAIVPPSRCPDLNVVP